jgi:Ax21 family sulfation-dependent quorum factor
LACALPPLQSAPTEFPSNATRPRGVNVSKERKTMKRSLIALALAAVLPLSAQAGELSYNFVQLDYTRASIDGVDADPDGFTLKGSAALGERFYLFGSYLKGNDSIDGLDFDYDQTQVGFGFRHGISDKADFLAEISYLNSDLELEDEFDASADGYRASVGIRGLMAPKFEGYAKANWTDGGDVDGAFSGTLGALFKINQTWGINAEAEFGEDATVWGLGVRASF